MAQKFTDIETYRDLLTYLQGLSDKQLDQKVQVAEPSPLEIQPLIPVLAIGTVKQMGFYGCRSSIDNRYHGNEVVLLSDGSGFGEDGAVAYEMPSPKKRRKGAKRRPQSLDDLFKGKPIYGKDGKTPRAEQIAPEFRDKPLKTIEDFREIRKRKNPSEEAIMKKRVAGVDSVEGMRAEPKKRKRS
jgi:hypothetical protein